MEEVATGTLKKIKKRKLRDAGSQQPQYVIVDDPNQILPKTRRVKKVSGSKSPSSQQQKVYLAMQPTGKNAGSGALQHMTLQNDGNHYKLTKLNNSMHLNKVILGKDAVNLPV